MNFIFLKTLLCGQGIKVQYLCSDNIQSFFCHSQFFSEQNPKKKKICHFKRLDMKQQKKEKKEEVEEEIHMLM